MMLFAFILVYQFRIESAAIKRQGGGHETMQSLRVWQSIRDIPQVDVIVWIASAKNPRVSEAIA